MSSKIGDLSESFQWHICTMIWQRKSQVSSFIRVIVIASNSM